MTVDVDVIRDHIAPICLTTTEPSIFLAKTLARSSVIDEIIGPKLAVQVRAYMHAIDFNTDPTEQHAGLMPTAMHEIISLRKQLLAVKVATENGRIDAVRDLAGSSMVLSSPAKNLGTWAAEKLDAQLLQKHELATMTLSLTLAFRHAPEAVGKVRMLDQGATTDLCMRMSSDRRLRDHVLTLDEALDAYTAKRIAEA